MLKIFSTLGRPEPEPKPPLHSIFDPVRKGKLRAVLASTLHFLLTPKYRFLYIYLSTKVLEPPYFWIRAGKALFFKSKSRSRPFILIWARAFFFIRAGAAGSSPYIWIYLMCQLLLNCLHLDSRYCSNKLYGKFLSWNYLGGPINLMKGINCSVQIIW